MSYNNPNSYSTPKKSGGFKEAPRPKGEAARYLYRVWGLNKHTPEDSLECFRCIDIAEWQCQKCGKTICRQEPCHEHHDYEHVMDKIAL